MQIYNTLFTSAISTDNRVKRKSSIKAIRILAMCMIMMHHFLSHALKFHTDHPEIYNIINPFVYGGVNLFFLISGYFLIKFNIKSLLKLLMSIIFVRFICLAICGYVGAPVSIMDFIKTILLPISWSRYWFLQVYLAILLVSPIINAGLQSLSLKQMRGLVVTLSLFITYSCWGARNSFDSMGYSFGHGLFLYFIGYYIALEEKSWSNIKAIHFFISATIILSGISILNHTFETGWFMQYNSPLMIIAMVFLFVGFSKLNFSSIVINSLGATSLVVYLIHDGEFGEKFLYDWLHTVSTSTVSVTEKALVFAVVFLGIWIAAWTLTKLFNLIWSNILSPALTSSLSYAYSRYELLKN